MTLRILVAPQEFKGTLSARDAAWIIALALRAFDTTWRVNILPMADGGPGTLDAVLTGRVGERRTGRVADPFMRPVDADWGLLDGGAAVIECAAAAGLWRLDAAELDPRRASSFGTGEQIAAALDAGCHTIQIGLGGSATNDGGAGMAQALGYRLLDAAGDDLPPGGAALARLARIDTSAAHSAIKKTRFYGLTDVTNPLCGPDGASTVYGPQKGADPAAVAELDAALVHFAEVIERDIGVDVRTTPGAGAAGGLGAGLIAFLGAELGPGARLVGDIVGLETRIAQSDIVITGEGRLDEQTDFGKGPAYVAALARAAGKPCVCIAGVVAPAYDISNSPFGLIEATALAGSAVPSREEAKHTLTKAVERAALRFGELVG